jgi:hypothetical protein
LPVGEIDQTNAGDDRIEAGFRDIEALAVHHRSFDMAMAAGSAT